jgi:hypothetical protein
MPLQYRRGYMRSTGHDSMRHAIVRSFFFVVLPLLVVLAAADGFAAIPLVTDDTSTMGKAKYQLDVFGEYGRDRDARITSNTSDFYASVTYGISDPVDLSVTIPYQFWRSEDSGSRSKGDGISDIAIEVKWRFYEREGLSFAVKPGFTIPTGDDEKGLGTGRVTSYLYLIATKEAGPWAVHMNLGYIRNENRIEQRKNIWHASLASTYEVIKGLKLVGDIGAETNTDRSSKTPPVYILGGIIYSVSEHIDVGVGIKGGLTGPEKDITVRGGITWAF